MNRIGRRVRATINPVSTAVTRWWCHSAMRHVLTGYGPTARQRRLMRSGVIEGARRPPSVEEAQAARAAAIDELLAMDARLNGDDHEM
jgi:hypothetical protein